MDAFSSIELRKKEFVKATVSSFSKRFGINVVYNDAIVDVNGTEKRSLKNSFVDIALSSASYIESNFQLLSEQELKNILILEVPRKIEDHKVVVAANTISVQRPKVTRKRSLNPKSDDDSKRLFKRREEKENIEDKESPSYKKIKGEHFDMSLDFKNNIANTFSDDSMMMSTVSQEKACLIINNIFKDFWEIEIDDSSVNGAIFGRINYLNYKEFGMENYIEDYCNLPVIKVDYNVNLLVV
jgi:hypothetical protein